MRNERRVVTDTHEITIGTSERDGYMHLCFRDKSASFDLKLTDDNKAALRTLLGPTDTWSGILK